MKRTKAQRSSKEKDEYQVHKCQCVWATQKTQPEKGARCFIKGVWATVRIVQLMTMCKTGIDKQATDRVNRVGVEGLQKRIGWKRESQYTFTPVS